MDYKTVFTNLCLDLQQNWSWIKGLGKNPFTHSIPFTHSLTAVPFVRGHRSVFPRTPRNTGVYTRHPTFVTATSGVLTRLPAWLSKNTASEAKGLRSQCVKHVNRHQPIVTPYAVHSSILPPVRVAFSHVQHQCGTLSQIHAFLQCIASRPFKSNVNVHLRVE